MQALASYSRLVAIVTFFGFTLAGCLDDGGGQTSTQTGTQTDAQIDPEADYDVALSGSVGDGPIAGAALSFQTTSGEVLATVTGGQDASYNVGFKTKGKHYPVLIEATGGIDLVTSAPPDFTLWSALTEPRNNAVANVNPFSTLAVETARRMSGGLTTSNLGTAMESVMAELSFGLTSLVENDPISTPIDDSNLAELVKASEALAEMFRRTNATMITAGRPSSVDAVVTALGADLADGRLDGRGGAQADPHVSAAAKVVAAQVVIETMANRLHVHGIDATAALDDVIDRLGSGGTSSPTAALPTTAAMIEQAVVGVDAALAMAPTSRLEALRASLNELAAGMSPDTVRGVLASDAELELDAPILQLASGVESDIDAVNTGASGTTAPTISGTPATQVVVGESYLFEPTAADADGDPLSFSISGKPAWAAFDTSTGALSGTPGSGDVATFDSIVISVTDGPNSAALPAFSISVVAVTNGTATLSWLAPTENTDGSSLTDLAGYSLHWGKQSGSYPNAVDVNAGITSYVVENLSQGTWYFATRARNADGVYSDYSNEASKTIQ